MTSNRPDTYTTGMMAKLIGVSQRTIIRWYDAGKIQGYRPAGTGNRRILRANVQKFLNDYWDEKNLEELEDRLDD